MEGNGLGNEIREWIREWGMGMAKGSTDRVDTMLSNLVFGSHHVSGTGMVNTRNPRIIRDGGLSEASSIWWALPVLNILDDS